MAQLKKHLGKALVNRKTAEHNHLHATRRAGVLKANATQTAAAAKAADTVPGQATMPARPGG